MGDYIPQWARERADTLIAEYPWPVAWTGDLAGNRIALAFARYIAAHEEPPVDPITAKVGDAFAAIWDSDEYGTKEQWAEAMQAQLAERNLKIVEAF